jgi:hypothetical protein
MSTFLDNEKPFLLTLPLNELGGSRGRSPARQARRLSSRGIFYSASGKQRVDRMAKTYNY